MAEQRRVDLLNLARQQLLEQGGQSLGGDGFVQQRADRLVGDGGRVVFQAVMHCLALAFPALELGIRALPDFQRGLFTQRLALLLCLPEPLLGLGLGAAQELVGLLPVGEFFAGDQARAHLRQVLGQFDRVSA